MIKDVLLLLQGLPGSMVRPHPQNELEHVLTSYGTSRLNCGLQIDILRFAAIGGQYKCAPASPGTYTAIGTYEMATTCMLKIQS